MDSVGHVLMCKLRVRTNSELVQATLSEECRMTIMLIISVMICYVYIL